MSQKTIRIIALVLAILMAGSVLIVAFTNVFAYDEETTYQETTIAVDSEQNVILAASEMPETGTDGPPKAPIIIGAAAVVLAIACAIIPKFAKK